MNRGKFIVFEGIDCSGKTTQSRLIADAMGAANFPVVQFAFPDRSSPIGKILNEFLKTGTQSLPKESIQLLFSANRWEVMDSIKKYISEGTTVLCDRYIASGIVYGVARGLPEKWCRMLEYGLLNPDLTCYMDICPEEAKKRNSFGRELSETLPFQEQVYAIFKKYTLSSRWKIFDASAPIETVTNALFKEIIKLY